MPVDFQDSCYWVLPVSGWVCVSKTIIPEAQEHFLTPSAGRHTHLFGGLGLDGEFIFRIVRPMGLHEMLQSRGADGA